MEEEQRPAKSGGNYDDDSPLTPSQVAPTHEIIVGETPGPSSSVDNDDHDDDDEARAARLPDGVGVGSTSLDDDVTTPSLPPLPERTLKEKLVERERQKRIETERARLKRQFALSNGGILESIDDNDGSVVGTVGDESSVAAAAVDDESQDENKAENRLGYAMERFLSEQGAVMNGAKKPPATIEKEETGGVVMERFLSEPVVVPPVVVEEPPPSLSDVQISDDPPAPLSVTFGDADEIHPNPINGAQPDSIVVAGSLSFSSAENGHIITMDSLDADAPDGVDLARFSVSGGSSREPDSPSHAHAGSSVSSLASTDQGPRFGRLTEREIQEMAAIEEASIGNAPPSEREDTLSEVGDLVAMDTPAHLLDPAAFSVQTRTTASASHTSARESRGVRSQDEGEDQHTLDGIDTASVSSHLALSPGGSDGSVSVTVNPPSVVANDNEEQSRSLLVPDRISSPIPPTVSAVIPTLPSMPNFDDTPMDAEASALANADVVNRRHRPGMTMTPPRDHQTSPLVSDTGDMKRVLSMPDKMHTTIDGFDYDKFDYSSAMPRFNVDDSPHHDSWGAPDEDAMMNVSPLQSAKRPFVPSGDSESASDLKPAYQRNYGALDNLVDSPPLGPRENDAPNYDYSDRDALLPRSVVQPEFHQGHKRVNSFADVFEKVRADSPLSFREVENDVSAYLKSDIFKRAFPERMIALMVTLIIEIPVLLMIAGGSDRLCVLIGRRRYQLLLGFLPLSSAISGNCGLQASTLTTRAISHDQVTADNFRHWLSIEVGAALMLGLGMGFVLGVTAYLVSERDFAFGFTIFVAQFISILTAGFTGTVAPLIFTFIFRRDSGKWGGPLETAIQDIVGSFAMVVLSYHILLIFGQRNVEPWDVCGSDDNDFDDDTT